MIVGYICMLSERNNNQDNIKLLTLGFWMNLPMTCEQKILGNGTDMEIQRKMEIQVEKSGRWRKRDSISLIFVK